MGETNNSKYQPYCLEKLKNNYKKILLISEKSQSFCAECLIDSLKDKPLRKKKKLKKRKNK